MTFPGGEVTIPTPTRADLILSAKQWITAARERMTDCADERLAIHDKAYVIGALDHAMRALKEAEANK